MHENDVNENDVNENGDVVGEGGTKSEAVNDNDGLEPSHADGESKPKRRQGRPKSVAEERRWFAVSATLTGEERQALRQFQSANDSRSVAAATRTLLCFALKELGYLTPELGAGTLDR